MSDDMLKKIDLSGGTGGRGGQTVYTAPNGVVVTSSAATYNSNGYYYMEYLFNGTIITSQQSRTGGTGYDYWLTSSGGNQTLTFDFSALPTNVYERIRKIVVYPRTRTDASSNYRIFVSNDGSNYTEIVPWVTTNTSTPFGTAFEHEIGAGAKFIRFELTRNGRWGVTLDEIEFYYEEEYTSVLYTEAYINSPYSKAEREPMPFDLSDYDEVVYVDVGTGEDSTGYGIYGCPYKTLEFAFSKMTNKKYAIVLGEGTYNFGRFTQTTPSTKVAIIGQGRKTVLKNTEGIYSNGTNPSVTSFYFYRLVWDGNKDNVTYAHNFIAVTNRWEWHNVAFTNIPDNDYSYINGGDKVMRNCVKDAPSRNMLRTTNGTLRLINCYGAFSSGYGTTQASWDFQTNIITDTPELDEDFNITGDVEWRGVGMSPDGGYDDLGVYGGWYSWTNTGYAHQIEASVQVSPYSDVCTTISVFKNEIEYDAYDWDEDVTLPMTANSSNGQVVSASSQYSATFAPWKAFDHKNSVEADRWVTADGQESGWIQVQLNSPVSVIGYTIHSPAVVSNNDWRTTPESWLLYGSNDGSTWVEIHRAGGQPIWSAQEKRTFVLDNPTEPYLYYRCQLHNIGGGSRKQLTVGEIELFSYHVERAYQVKSYVYIPYRSDMASHIYVKPNGYMEATAQVAPIYHENIEATISVKNTSNVFCGITVPPHNRMELVLDVVPPPRITEKFAPIMDAFVRENVPRLNYGVDGEMVVGEGFDGEKFYSLVYFDISSIPKGMRIVRAELKLYSKQENEDPIGLSVHEVYEDWTELGVTWANRPMPGEEVAFRLVGREKGLVTINLMGIVDKWYKGEKENKGLYLVPFDQGMKQYARFSTKEGAETEAPVLEIEYYDPEIKSIGYLDAETGITVRQLKYADLVVKGTVKSDWGFENFLSYMKVHNQDMRESFLTIIKPEVPGGVVVRQSDHDGIGSDITVRVRRTNDNDSFISVNRPFVIGGVTARRTEDDTVDSEVTIRRTEDDVILTQLGITRDTVEGSVVVYISNAIEGNIQVIKKDGDTIGSHIVVRQADDSNIDSDIEVWSNSGLPATITTRSGYLLSGIIVPYKADKDITTKINVRIRYASDKTAYIEVIQASSIESSIVVRQSDDKDVTSEVTIRKEDEKDITVTIIVSVSGAYGFIM